MIQEDKTEHLNPAWSLANVLILASVLTVTAICIYLFVHSYDKENMSLSGYGRITKNETVFKNYNVVYPIFHNEKVDMMMRNYVTHQADDFLQRVGKDRNDPDNSLTINYTIMHYDARTLTIMFHESQRLHGKSQVRSQKIMTYDLQKQTQLQLSDVFEDKTAAVMLIRRILHDYFQQQTTEPFTTAELEKLSGITLENIREFVVDDDAITLYIDPRQPTSEQSNTTISIKKELLSVVLNDGYVKPSPSLTQRTTDQATYAIDAMPRHDISTDPDAKLLALTFDDGPGNLTPGLLDVLKKYGAHATFFVIGRQVAPYAGVVRREVVEGNEVGNHSWSHPNLSLLSYSGLQQQIGDTQRAVKEATGGYEPVLVRPPQGVFNAAVATYIRSLGLNLQLWNVDTLDWLNRDSQVVYDRIMSGAADGRVILLHDIHPTSIDAATRAIPELVARGYELVTVSELGKYR